MCVRGMRASSNRLIDNNFGKSRGKILLVGLAHSGFFFSGVVFFKNSRWRRTDAVLAAVEGESFSALVTLCLGVAIRFAVGAV